MHNTQINAHHRNRFVCAVVWLVWLARPSLEQTPGARRGETALVHRVPSPSAPPALALASVSRLQSGLLPSHADALHVGASLSKLNELWQEYMKHKPCMHMFLCVHVKELRRLREMSVARFVGVRGGSKLFQNNLYGSVPTPPCLAPKELQTPSPMMQCICLVYYSYGGGK